MTGCYGNSKEDRYFENKLNEYLDSMEYGYTGHFSDYELEIPLSEAVNLYVEVCGRIEEDKIVELEYDDGYVVNSNGQTTLTKEEIDKIANVGLYADDSVSAIIEWALDI